LIAVDRGIMAFAQQSGYRLAVSQQGPFPDSFRVLLGLLVNDVHGNRRRLPCVSP
jgi:hypothetical protein